MLNRSACWVLLLLTTAVSAEESAVHPATHIASAPPSLGSGIRFLQQPTIAGERVIQRVGMELKLHTTIKQGGQVAHDGSTELRRRQERDIQVLEVAEGKARKAKVTYPLSRLMSPENADPADEIAQVVEGKSYLVTRENDRLFITDTEGSIPTSEEYEIVVSTMESFGKPNPLAEFLLTQEVRVGEVLQVPTELATKMIGFDSLGDVQKFEMLLVEVKDVHQKKCAVFNATILAKGKPENPLQVEAHGAVVVELATCRTTEATLTGPISMLSADQGIEYSASGNLLLAIRSQYGTTK